MKNIELAQLAELAELAELGQLGQLTIVISQNLGDNAGTVKPTPADP